VRRVTRRRALLLGGGLVAAATLRRMRDGNAPPSPVSGCASVPPSDWRGVDTVSGEEIRVLAGSMPDGASSAGEYVSPQLGRLTLAQTSGVVSGTYTSSATGESGVLRGSMSGNLVEFEWQASLALDGASRQIAGRGYFIVDRVTSGARVRLFGRRSFGAARVSWSSGVGQTWTATRTS